MVSVKSAILAALLMIVPALSLQAQLPLLGVGKTGGGGGGGQSFTLVQHVENDNFNCCANAGTCLASATTCTTNITSTGSGHLLVVAATTANNRAVNSPTASTSQGTWSQCVGCAGFLSGSGGVDVWYVTASTSGATSITCNLASADGTYFGCYVAEYSSTSTATFDKGNTVSRSACNTSCAAPTLTGLTGTSDLFIQVAAPTNGCSAISGAYTNFADFPSSFGYAAAVNQASYTAPNWTCNATDSIQATAIAFK